jgi:hypothetical protein
MILVFVAWLPVIIWQTSPGWGPALLGEATYYRIMSTYVFQVVAIASTAGMFITGMGFILMPVFGIFKGMSDRAKLRAVGVPGQAIVRSIGESGAGTVTVNDQPLLSLTLEVNDGYGTPYLVSFETIVPRYAVPQVQPGDTIPIKIDPNDPQRVAVDWGAMGYS